MLPKAIVVVVGACLHMASTMVMGYRVHRFLLKHTPGLGVLIPRDGGAVLGAAVGAYLLWRWLQA
jgi:hypothetical protein